LEGERWISSALNKILWEVPLIAKWRGEGGKPSLNIPAAKVYFVQQCKSWETIAQTMGDEERERLINAVRNNNATSN